MTTTDWKKLESTYYMQVVNRLPLVLVKGQGTIVWDESGKKYLDFTSGWAVMNLGHTHPAVSNAMTEKPLEAAASRSPLCRTSMRADEFPCTYIITGFAESGALGAASTRGIKS